MLKASILDLLEGVVRERGVAHIVVKVEGVLYDSVSDIDDE